MDAAKRAALKAAVEAAKQAKVKARSAGPLMEPGLAVPDLTGLAHGVFDHIKSPVQRAFLRAYSMCGRPVKACQMAGIHQGQPYKADWKNDPVFQAAYALAKEIAAAWAEDEVFRRAVEGDRRYQFNKKTGEPLMHPDLCDCGHHRRAHEGNTLACGEPGCSCYKFQPAPYYEVQRSDRLLERVLQARLPQEWSERRQVEVRGLLQQLDVTRLPTWAVNRLANGESVAGILMEMSDAELAAATGRDVKQVTAGAVQEGEFEVEGEGEE